jgi:7-carboxy-7-deazaguanine synthase
LENGCGDESSFFDYHDSSAAGGGGLHYCPAVHGNSARVSAAADRDSTFFRDDLLVVAAERSQGQFRPSVGCKGVGRAQPERRRQAAALQSMVITEIFKSIQGEGTRAGLPCIFVRLTGCNLRCTWCDTAYAFHGGKKMSVEEVLARVDELAGRREMPGSQASVPLVELTGGEPLLQEEIVPLAEKLLAEKYGVMIETSGERFIGGLPREVIKIVDVKCPDSGEPDTFEMRNLEALSENDEVKFVLSTRRDYEFAREFTAQHGLAQRVKQVLFSPVSEDPQGKWPGLEPRLLVEWILADGLPVRLGLQLHKFIWDPATKGV